MTRSMVLALPDQALLPVSSIRPLLERRVAEEAATIGLTVAEAAKRAGRAPSTIRTWCAQGRLRGARRLMGREWRIPIEALRTLLEEPESVPRGGAAKRLKALPGGLSAWREDP